ncbi:hypothetical protein D3C76_1788260 [compost metagenome]
MPSLVAYCGSRDWNIGDFSRLPSISECTVMPYSARSSARDWVSPTPPNLAAL